MHDLDLFPPNIACNFYQDIDQFPVAWFSAAWFSAASYLHNFLHLGCSPFPFFLPHLCCWIYRIIPWIPTDVGQWGLETLIWHEGKYNPVHEIMKWKRLQLKLPAHSTVDKIHKAKKSTPGTLRSPLSPPSSGVGGESSKIWAFLLTKHVDPQTGKYQGSQNVPISAETAGKSSKESYWPRKTKSLSNTECAIYIGHHCFHIDLYQYCYAEIQNLKLDEGIFGRGN